MTDPQCYAPEDFEKRAAGLDLIPSVGPRWVDCLAAGAFLAGLSIVPALALWLAVRP